jgi:hypothetical protein
LTEARLYEEGLGTARRMGYDGKTANWPTDSECGDHRQHGNELAAAEGCLSCWRECKAGFESKMDGYIYWWY